MLEYKVFHWHSTLFEHEYLKILVLSNYHIGVVFPGTKCERCLSSIGSGLSVRNLHFV